MIKIFKNFTKKDKLAVLFCIVLVISQVWLELKMPEYMSEITRLVQTDDSTMKEILTSGAYMLLCALGSLVTAILVGYISSKLSANFSRNIRKKIFEKVENFGIAEIKKFSTSSLITRTTNDVTQLEMLISMGMQMLLKAPIMAVWAVIKIVGKSTQWSMLTATGVLILLITDIFYGVNRCAILPYFKMNMRPRAVAGASGKPYYISLFYSLSNGNKRFIHMTVSCHNSVTMVNIYAYPVPSVPACLNNRSVLCRHYIGSHRNREIYTVVVCSPSRTEA